MKFATIGSALQDIYLIDRSDFAPMNIADRPVFGKVVFGSKVDIDKISYEVGGGGTNAAVTFARSEFDVCYFGTVSHDAAGAAVLAALDDEGIDTSYVSYSRSKHTGCSIIMLDEKTGERTILTHRGASAHGIYNAKNLEEVRPDYLYSTSLSGDLETLTDFFKTAHKVGAKVMFNPGELELRRSDGLKKMLKHVDILLLNRREASQLVPGETLEELLSHLNNYVDIILLTDGQNGGIATNSEVTYRFGIYEDVKVKDTTGAGDAFGSGFLAYLASHSSFKNALVFGSANSTSVIQQIGAKRGILPSSTPVHPMPIQKIT